MSWLGNIWDGQSKILPAVGQPFLVAGVLVLFMFVRLDGFRGPISIGITG